MVDSDKLNIDSIIARLLEGETTLDMTTVVTNADSVPPDHSERIASRQECTAVRSRDQKSLCQIPGDLPKSAHSSRVGGAP